ncbi:MAG: hypothetical protein JWQ53_1201 [Klenkia sp.]|nr:hypothetical protein [Klenkia sp.]
MTGTERRTRASKDADKYLLPDEQAVVAARRHWAVLVRPAVRGVPALLAGLWVLQVDPDNRFTATVGLVVAVAALVYLAVHVIEWRVRQFLVTDRRVLMTSGVLVRTVAMMPLRRVTDLTYQETPVGQVLGYGTFRFESAGQDQALSRITYLPDATDLYDRITGLLFPAGGRRGDDDEGGGPTGAPPPRAQAFDPYHRVDTAPIPGYRNPKR